MSSPAEKRCLYEVLGVSPDCTADEIRSAYKRQALRCHPDKLIQSGISGEKATASFQELGNAYEILSDPIERYRYDSNRRPIPSSNAAPTPPKPRTSPNESIPDLSSFFTDSVFSGYSDSGKGFYKVYGDVFDKIFENEVKLACRTGMHPWAVKKPPSIGNLNSPYEQLIAFYAYWLGFITVISDDDRKNSRRNKYIETVRELASFVRKRDKRVIDRKLKKKKEKKERRKRKGNEKQSPKLAEDEEDEEEVEDEVIEFIFRFQGRTYKLTIGWPSRNESNRSEFYCAACVKKYNFKSEKQWKKHEQCKKHKGKVSSHVEKEKGEKK